MPTKSRCAWDELPEADRQTFIANAPTWLDECRDPGAFTLELEDLASFSRPAFLTQGDQSAPYFAPVIDQVAAALPHARRFTFMGSGHVPHVTHPDAFLARMKADLGTYAREPSSGSVGPPRF